MPTAQQRTHNQVHTLGRKIRKKENALIKVSLREAKTAGFPWRYRARIYRKLFTLLEERCKREKPTKKV